MKTQFLQKELYENRGCYEEEKIQKLIEFYGSKEEFSIKEIILSDISLQDKRWFIYNNCELNIEEKKNLSLKLAWCVLPIYESQYPNDSRIKDCLQAIKDFKNGKITIEILNEKRHAAYAAYTAAAAADADASYTADAAAAYAAAYAADAAVYVAGYAAVYTATAAYAAVYTATAAYAAADAAINAANSAVNSTYTQKIIEILINFMK